MSGRPMLHVDCPACGYYIISRMLYTSKTGVDDNQRYILSGFIRENSPKDSPIVIGTDSIRKLADLAVVPKTPMDKMNRIMQYFGGISKEAGAGIAVDPDIDYPVAYARSPGEFEFLIKNLKDAGLIDFIGNLSYAEYRVTIDGWKYLMDISSKTRISDIAFVAMCFNGEFDVAWEKGFKAALEKCGFKPVRIDLVQHNDDISDKIIAGIRQAGLLVADCTGLRPNVFFEAGFALGLGTPVIWTCRCNQIKDLPFDTRQYNHIGWERETDLYEKLVDRIMATGLAGN